MVIRVCLCFEADLYRLGVVRTLQSGRDIDIGGITADPDELPSMVLLLTPDVVLIDADARHNSLLAVWRLSRAGTSARIVTLGLDNDREGAALAMRCGAHLCIPRSVTARDLRRAVRDQRRIFRCCGSEAAPTPGQLLKQSRRRDVRLRQVPPAGVC